MKRNERDLPNGGDKSSLVLESLDMDKSPHEEKERTISKQPRKISAPIKITYSVRRKSDASGNDSSFFNSGNKDHEVSFSDNSIALAKKTPT